MSLVLKLDRWSLPNKLRKIYSERFMPVDNLTETPTLKQQILSTKIKVLSRVCATKNELKQPTNEIEETIYVTEYNSGTEYVKPSNNTKPRQETFSENKTPKELLPP